MYITLESERLRLRPIRLDDAGFIHELVNSSGWLKFIGDRKVNNKADAEKYIQSILNKPNYHYTVFELKSSGQAAGIVTFLHRDDEPCPDIGFAMLPEFEKQGFALEASQAYLDSIKASKLYGNVIAVTKPDNTKSINLLNKLGLMYIGDREKGKEVLSYYSLQKFELANKIH